jgi:exonuclease VII small subunit
MKILINQLINNVSKDYEFIVYLLDNNDNNLEAVLCNYENLMDTVSKFRLKLKNETIYCKR